MNKLIAKQQAVEKKKTAIVTAVALVILVLNIVLLHHFSRHGCPKGGTYTSTGATMGLPMAYHSTWQTGLIDCKGFTGGDATDVEFSAQALLGDALVFGLVMLGVNILLDRRTMA